MLLIHSYMVADQCQYLNIGPKTLHGRGKRHQCKIGLIRRQDLFSEILDKYLGNGLLRIRSQGGLFHRLARQCANGRILDIAAGSGPDLLNLLIQGFRVEGNEMDDSFKRILYERLTKRRLHTRIFSIDWRRFLSDDCLKSDSYSLLYSLGNSFPTYIHDYNERIRCLIGFRRLLRTGGLLLFDTRNYDYMLDCWPQIADDPIASFRYNAKSTYLDNVSVAAFPYHLRNRIAHFIWIETIRCIYATQRFYAIRKDEVLHLMKKTGFRPVSILYDYSTIPCRTYDFIQFIAQKK